MEIDTIVYDSDIFIEYLEALLLGEKKGFRIKKLVPLFASKTRFWKLGLSLRDPPLAVARALNA